jgi:hypothetical protein
MTPGRVWLPKRRVTWLRANQRLRWATSRRFPSGGWMRCAFLGSELGLIVLICVTALSRPPPTKNIELQLLLLLLLLCRPCLPCRLSQFASSHAPCRLDPPVQRADPRPTIASLSEHQHRASYTTAALRAPQQHTTRRRLPLHLRRARQLPCCLRTNDSTPPSPSHRAHRSPCRLNNLRYVCDCQTRSLIITAKPSRRFQHSF